MIKYIDFSVIAMSAKFLSFMWNGGHGKTTQFIKEKVIRLQGAKKTKKMFICD